MERCIENEEDWVRKELAYALEKKKNIYVEHLAKYVRFENRELHPIISMGYYYTKLNYGDSIPRDDCRRILKGEGFHIADEAVLYQIAAMNTYYLPMFTLENGIARPVKGRGAAAECWMQSMMR